MDVDQFVTFAALVTPPGAIAAALMVRTAVEVAKRYVAVRGDILALVAVVALYVVAWFATSPANADAGLNLVWTAILALAAAIGVDAVVRNVAKARGA